jgi:hypothetical protein
VRPVWYAEAQQVGLTMVLAKWHRILENFEVLFKYFNIARGETKCWEALRKTILKLQPGVGKANGWAVILSTKLGADPVVSDHEPLTIWEAYLGMKNDISGLGTAAKSGRKVESHHWGPKGPQRRSRH